MDKHTEGPWEFENPWISGDDSDGGGVICDQPPKHEPISRKRWNANAKRIVECVNALDGIANPNAIPDLVEAAQALHDACEYEANENGGIYSLKIGEPASALETALAKVRGEDHG